MKFDFFDAFGGRRERSAKQRHAELVKLINDTRIHMDQRLQDVLDKLQEIKNETGQYIADRDARDVALQAALDAKDATIADLTAQLAAGAITIAEFNAGLDAAKTAATEAADLLPAIRVPEVITEPPVVVEEPAP